MVTAAEAECEVAVQDVIFRSPALPTSPRMHFLVLRHRSSAATTRPVGLRTEDSWIGLAPLLTDVFPLRPVVKAPAVTTLTVGTPPTCKIAMVHSNPPFWPPIFLGADCNNTRNQLKVNSSRGQTKTEPLAEFCLKNSK